MKGYTFLVTLSQHGYVTVIAPNEEAAEELVRSELACGRVELYSYPHDTKLDIVGEWDLEDEE